MGVHSGPWAETSYLKLCQSSRTRWMLCSSLTAQRQWVNVMDSFEDCDDNNYLQDLNNGVINACFMLLFRDLIRLFACYNDGIINLLEKYFEMGKKQTRDALDLYKKFLIRMDRGAEFLKVAEVSIFYLFHNQTKFITIINLFHPAEVWNWQGGNSRPRQSKQKPKWDTYISIRVSVLFWFLPLFWFVLFCRA